MQSKAEDLIQAANDAGGKDNITVVLLKNPNEPKALAPVVEISRGEKHKTETKGTLLKERKSALRKTKKSHQAAIVLTLFCLFIVYSMVSVVTKKRTAADIPKNVIPQVNHALADLLQSTIKGGRVIYSLPPDDDTINVNGAATISGDSCIIMGNGTHLIADSGYLGAAIMIQATSKYIVLDSLVFENFSAPVRSYTSNIVLKNVRFVNCTNPVQMSLSFRDTIISGRLTDSVFLLKYTDKVINDKAR